MPLLLALWTLLAVADLCATEDTVIYRLFLKNGQAVATFGEYARVGDRVVFSMSVGANPSDPVLQLVSMPAVIVDWAKTDTYAEAARYERYVATHAESDFARMSADVAAALNKIATTEDKSVRLGIAEQAKRTLIDWPRANYGYRADDVRQIAALLDEVISELRAATGASTFDLSLVATPLPPPRVPLLPTPSIRETVEQIVAVARASDAPAERMSLLRSAVALVGDLRVGADESSRKWVPQTRSWLGDAIEAELNVEKRYAKLTRSLLGKAMGYAAAADVRGVERVLLQVRTRDGELGGKRPDIVISLIAAVQERLDAARHLRLARDAWQSKKKALRAYHRGSDDAIGSIRKLQPLLLEIKTLSGPDVTSLARMEQRVGAASRTLTTLDPPSDVRPIHAQLSGALHFAASAVRLRREAIASGDLRRAWDASSAAAACLMLLDRAAADLERAVKPPEISRAAALPPG